MHNKQSKDLRGLQQQIFSSYSWGESQLGYSLGYGLDSGLLHTSPHSGTSVLWDMLFMIKVESTRIKPSCERMFLSVCASTCIVSTNIPLSVSPIDRPEEFHRGEEEKVNTCRKIRKCTMILGVLKGPSKRSAEIASYVFLFSDIFI